MARIAVLGAGSWGTALAIIAARAGHEVPLWGRDPMRMAEIAASRVNRARLPETTLPMAVQPTADLAAALLGSDLAILAVPMQQLRAIAAGLLSLRAPILIAAKGLETGTGLRASGVVRDAGVAVEAGMLSGPSFASEAAQGLPTAVVVAFERLDRAAWAGGLLATATFRAYASDDLAGVEIGGAFKNVVAIAAGVVTGRGLGENARAAVITRGLAELVRLARALGGRAETLMGLAGLGDLVLTATSATSRNTALGQEIGRGRPVADLLGAGRALAEGAATAAAACALGAQHGLELPIADAVRRVVTGEVAVEAAVLELLSRPLPERE